MDFFIKEVNLMATSVALTTPAAAVTQSTTAAAPNKSYLARCVEDLSADKVSTLDRQSTLWTVAAGATFVAFTVLAVGAFVATAVLLPAYVPVAGLSALLLAMPVANFVKNFLEYSENSRKEANMHREIQNNYLDLTQGTPAQVQIDLMRRGITWFQIPGQQISRPQDLAVLNPVLAKARQLDTKIQDHLQTKDELTAEARQLASADFAQNRQKIYDLRNAALFAEDLAMKTKIEAAFVNAVLRKGDFNGTLEDVATLSNIAYHERILGDELNDGAAVNQFLTFKNHAFAPITFDDVKRMNVAELGQRLVAAMA